MSKKLYPGMFRTILLIPDPRKNHHEFTNFNHEIKMKDHIQSQNKNTNPKTQVNSIQSQ